MAVYTHNPLDITAIMTAANPDIVTQGSEYNSSYAGWMAFAHDGGEPFWSAGATADWIKWNAGEGNEKSINSYTITSRGDGYEYTSPASWTLKGSNNDSDWDTLDTQSGISWGIAEMKTFELASPSAAYRYFMLEVTSGGGAVAIGEIELLEPDSPVAVVAAPANYLHARRDRMNMKGVSLQNSAAEALPPTDAFTEILVSVPIPAVGVATGVLVETPVGSDSNPTVPIPAVSVSTSVSGP